MLKKLVKYGNSNAIILDKAILELLEIEEGATIKIKTDGKSIIITPHVKTVSEKLHETFTHEQATIEAAVQEGFKKYVGLEKEQKEKLENEYLGILKKYQSLALEVSKNPEYVKEVNALQKQYDAPSSELLSACKLIRNKYAPELTKVEEELCAFQSKNKLMAHTPAELTQYTPELQKAMEQEYMELHKKNHEIYKKYGELLNNPEYQHQAQLIAEKYSANKNSAEYMQAMDALHAAYLPEFTKAQEEAKAVALKYASKASK